MTPPATVQDLPVLSLSRPDGSSMIICLSWHSKSWGHRPLGHQPETQAEPVMREAGGRQEETADSELWLQVWESSGEAQIRQEGRCWAGAEQREGRSQGIHALEGVAFRTLTVSLKLGVPGKQQATLCPIHAAPSTTGTSSFYDQPYTVSICSPACAHLGPKAHEKRDVGSHH